jgi:hypothetical protein
LLSQWQQQLLLLLLQQLLQHLPSCIEVPVTQIAYLWPKWI